jgi:hypothetical protein
MKKGAKPKTCKKAKFKKIYFVPAGIAAIFFFLVILLLHKPIGYNPTKRTVEPQNQGKVSRYLTHQLLPNLYNGVQRGEPFELTIIQDGINDEIGSAKWPKDAAGIIFNVPQVVFGQGKIVLMGTLSSGGVDLVVSSQIEPAIDPNGMMSLSLTKITVGAVNVTPFAKALLSNLYTNYLQSKERNTDSSEAKVIFSLLEDTAFEPEFELEGRKVRIEKITVEQGILAMRLVPLED